MLSFGVENADAIHEAFKFTRPRPVLLVASQLFHLVDRMICFPLLVMALGWARLVPVAWLLLLLSGVEGLASSTRAYLLVMSNISFDILGFFLASLGIKDESLGPFLKNMMIDLSSTSRMLFHLL
jgi:hypothetical protein